MMASPTFALALTLALEVLALRNLSNKLLKVAATAASIYSLIAFLVEPPSGSFMTVWPLGMNIYCLIQRCVNYLWLRDANEFQRRDAAKDSERKGRNSAPRLCIPDALDIALTFRGVGWDFEAKGLPKPDHQYSSRLRFAFWQVFGSAWRFLALDFAISCANTFVESASDVSFFRRITLGALMMFYVRFTMDVPYRLLSAICVVLGFHEPREWPPLFGKWEDAYTVRRFWSHTWHQGMRLLAEPPVNYAATGIFGLPKQSYSSRWFKVFGNFFIAFLDHAYGRILAGGKPINDWVMFSVNPLAIWLEIMVRDACVSLRLLDKDQQGLLELYLGYCWTLAFECWTFFDFMEGAIRIHGSVPSSSLIEPAFGTSLALPIVQWWAGSLGLMKEAEFRTHLLGNGRAAALLPAA